MAQKVCCVYVTLLELVGTLSADKAIIISITGCDVTFLNTSIHRILIKL